FQLCLQLALVRDGRVLGPASRDGSRRRIAGRVREHVGTELLRRDICHRSGRRAVIGHHTAFHRGGPEMMNEKTILSYMAPLILSLSSACVGGQPSSEDDAPQQEAISCAGSGGAGGAGAGASGGATVDQGKCGNPFLAGMDP